MKKHACYTKFCVKATIFLLCQVPQARQKTQRCIIHCVYPSWWHEQHTNKQIHFAHRIAHIFNFNATTLQLHRISGSLNKINTQMMLQKIRKLRIVYGRTYVVWREIPLQPLHDLLIASQCYGSLLLWNALMKWQNTVAVEPIRHSEGPGVLCSRFQVWGSVRGDTF